MGVYCARRRLREGGQVLVLALVICLFLAFLGGAALWSALNECENALWLARRTEAEAIARAGIEQVIFWFNNSDKGPGSIIRQTGRTDWAYNCTFVHRGEDGYNDNDANGFYSPGDTLKTPAEDPLWYDFNGDGRYDSILGVLRNPGAWTPDVEIGPADLPTFPDGRIERLIVYAPPPATNPNLAARATILCTASAGQRSGMDSIVRVVMRCIIKDFRPFASIDGAIVLHGTAGFHAQSNIHWGNVFVLDGEPYLDANQDGMFDVATETYVDTNGNGQYDSQGTGGSIDFGTLNIGNKIDTYSRDPWTNYYADREILTSRPFTSGNFRTLGSPYNSQAETYTIPQSYTPMPDGDQFYQLHRWILDVFDDKNKNGKWDAGPWPANVVWDKGLDGIPLSNDIGEGNGIFNAEPFIDANGNGVWDHTPDLEPYWDAGHLSPAAWTGAAWNPAIRTYTPPGGHYQTEYTDSQGNKYTCSGEGYRDLNGNDQWDPGEPFDDANHNGQYDGTLEPFTDANSNGRYDYGEPFEDLNGNAAWGYVVGPYWDRSMNGIHGGDGEAFYDLNENGTRDTEDYALEPYVDTDNNGHWDLSEPFTDLNGNGVCDQIVPADGTISEVYHDRNANSRFDGGERFVDLNRNFRYDAEPFTDTNGNGKCDVFSPAGEPFVDLNGNGRWDPDGAGEPFTDMNHSGKWDPDGGPAEPFTDLNRNGVWDPAEPYKDLNGNGKWDPAQKVKGRWVAAEPFVDVNLNGKYDVAEPFSDPNGNGKWDRTTPEPFADLNGNGNYDATGISEPYTDVNGNGKYDAVLGEPFQDVGLDGMAGTHDYGEGNGTYDQEPFVDDGVDGLGAGVAGKAAHTGWAGNGKCDGDPWMDTNGNGLMDGEPMADKNRNYRADMAPAFPTANYPALKAYAKQIGTYYYGDAAGFIYDAHGAVVNFPNVWANKTGFYFVDTTDQTPPRFPSGADPGNLVNLHISGQFFTRASLYVGGNLSFSGLGSGTSILAKNPGELRNDANSNGSYDAPNGEWTSTDPRGFAVHHASGMELYYDANGNGLYDFGEWFRDSNGNGKCDVEEYVDDLNPDGRPDDQSNFSSGQNFRVGPYYSLGSPIFVHIAGIVYCAGQFDGGGNCIVYGAVAAQKGFAVGGTPDVYYNSDLCYSMDSGIVVNVRPVSWEVLNR